MTNPKTNFFGDKYWVNSKGQFHRDEGPAYEHLGGTKVWYKNGLQHREDGPAVEHVDGCYNSWWINGKQIK